MKPYNAENKIEEYVNSRKNGIWIKYWPNGNIRSKINYKTAEQMELIPPIFKMER